MRDLDRWKDKVELQLDGRQIFFLFFGSALCACLIFVLGVVVGKRVEARAAAQAQAQAEDPLAVLDELGNAEEGLTFHSALLGDKQGARKGKGAKDEPKAEPAAEREPPEAKDAKAEGKKPEARPAEARPAAAEGKVAEAPAGKKAEEDAGKGEKKPAVAAKDVKAAEPKVDPKAKGHFTLQLSAFATKAEAGDFMKRLREAGYKPYVIESVIPGKGLMHRVRLGDFTSRDSALTAKNDFERKQKMVAYVAKL